MLGKGQKVVSYSWYKNTNNNYTDPKYEAGIRRNLAGIRAHYGQGWSMRLYTNQHEQDNPQFYDLIHKTGDFYWCDVTKLEDSGMIHLQFVFLLD